MKLLISLAFVVFSQISFATLRVAIDAGHGGNEQGAVYDGVVESQVALQIAKRLYTRLQKDTNFKAKMIRNANITIPLEDRVNLSEKFDTDLFVSIHANASPNEKASGFEVYIQNQLPAEEEALFLAHTEHSEAHKNDQKPRGDVEAILYDLKKSHKILKSYQVGTYIQKNWSNHKRKLIRQGPFFVLSQNEIPAILVEVGYLTNPKERARLIQKDYQNQIAKKIHRALTDYSKNQSKMPRGLLKKQ